VDPISYVIKTAGSPVHCSDSDITPPPYKLGKKWYWSYPRAGECNDPAMLPMEDLQIETLHIGLLKSICTKNQLDKKKQLDKFFALSQIGRDGLQRKE
jgi:hypothetical protein